jgi:hypothetical protein
MAVADGAFHNCIYQGRRRKQGSAHAPPEYNTVDATLWFFEAVRAYHAYGAVQDRRLSDEILESVREKLT